MDRVYMTFVQATTGSGGWPMSVWLTPELKPFFGGTYFPPDNRYGQPGFASILAESGARLARTTGRASRNPARRWWSSFRVRPDSFDGGRADRGRQHAAR